MKVVQPAPIIFQRPGEPSVAVSGVEMRPERAVLQVRLQEEEADPDTTSAIQANNNSMEVRPDPIESAKSHFFDY